MSGNRGGCLEQRLATVLLVGTWTASCLIGAGWVLTAASQPPLFAAGAAMLWSGIALFIVLPALRVLLMASVFVRDGDWRLGIVAAVVLALIAAGAVLGVRSGVVAG